MPAVIVLKNGKRLPGTDVLFDKESRCLELRGHRQRIIVPVENVLYWMVVEGDRNEGR